MTNAGPHAEAIAELLGLGAADVTAVVAGASNLGYEVRPVAGGDPVAFLRVQGHGALSQSTYSLHREADVVRAAGRAGFPVPEVLATFSEPTALLMSLVRGTSRPDPEHLDAVAREYMALVAQLHDADTSVFPVDQHATVTEAIEADLAFWHALAARAGVHEVPLLAAAERVLLATRPRDERPPVLVHGDAGGGNFMIDGGQVTAMLDWEMAHVGDPMEDLAWMWMRGAHTDFGDPGDRIADYAAASSHEIDPARIRWHVAAAMWKSCVSMEIEILTNGPSHGTVIHAVVLLTYEALLGAELMALLGQPFELLTQRPVAATGPGVRAAERLLELDLPREAAIIAEFLRDAAAHAPWERDALLDDTRRLLGIEPDQLPRHLADVADDDLGPVVEVLARAADRAAAASPKAIRRIQRAQGIGLGLSTGAP